jgi:hypothetical protein
MTGRLSILLLLMAAFMLYVGYWVIAHSFVIVRLTSVLGLMAVVAVFLFVIATVGKFFR